MSGEGQTTRHTCDVTVFRCNRARIEWHPPALDEIWHPRCSVHGVLSLGRTSKSEAKEIGRAHVAA